MTIEAEAPGAATLGGQDLAAATAAVKALLRVGQGSEDALIGDLVQAAITLAEAFVGQITIARALTETVSAGVPWQRLAACPVAAILGVASVSGDGVRTPLPDAAFAIDIDGAGDGWVRLCGVGSTRIEVSLTAGMAVDWASLPAPIRHGVVMLAAHLYDERDAGSAPPAAVTALWRPFRRMRLAEQVLA
jgi:uncharacterized phiE125 gp8 family phage protein